MKETTLLLENDQLMDELLNLLNQKFDVLTTDNQKGKLVLLAKQHRSRKSSIEKHGLSDRQVQIMNYLAEGLTYNEMSTKIGISVDGVRFHIKQIYRGLDVTNSREAIKKFFE